jgi:hypothetical protein
VNDKFAKKFDRAMGHEDLGKKFKRAMMHEELAALNLPSVHKLSAKMMLVVSRIEGWDPEADKEMWEQPLNQRQPRPDVVCDRCGQPVVMSNWAYPQFVKLRENGKKPSLICQVCFIRKIKEEGKK